MKNLLKLPLVIILAGALFTSCEKSEDQPAGTADNNAGNKVIDLEQVATYMAEAGYFTPNAKGSLNGNGAVFVTPGSLVGFIIFKDLVTDSTGIIGGQAGTFTGSYGKNDFWRENPDGTVSVKLSDNNGSLSYSDFDTSDEYEGTGNVHMIFTGEKIVIQVPFPPFELIFIQPGARGSVNMKGQGNVTLIGGSSMEYKLKGSSSSDANGGSHSKLEFN